MAADSTPNDTLIAGRYAVDPAKRLLEMGGGIPAFVAIDRKLADARLVALEVGRHAPPRLEAMASLSAPIDNLMMPLGHGVGPRAGGGQAYYVICSAPPGPPASTAPQPWTEGALLEQVLRPAATVLSALQEVGVTHRAIRPDNVFLGIRGQPATLGAAWAAPPAMHQPAIFEPPFSAMCHPAGRGAGNIVDDVYALGVLLIVMATGRTPMTGMDDGTVIRRKLDMGSFVALTDGLTLPSLLADLLRGMLADDPDHRPGPKLLTDLNNARVRRIAARPPRRSQRPLMLNDIAVFDARTLAYALTLDETKSLQALRTGAATLWLRRGLGDAGLAAQIEDLVRVRTADHRATGEADARLLMNTVSAIDPRMPLCWRSVALWPDGLPALLAEGVRDQPKMLTLVEELIRADIPANWAMNTPRTARADAANMLSLTPEGRQHRAFLQKGGENAMLRIFYALNPVLPCNVPAMADLWVISMVDLMRFLERSTASGAGSILIDSHIKAFIAARGDRHVEPAVRRLMAATEADAVQKLQISLLRDLQQRYLPQPLPALAAWAGAQLRPELNVWRNRRKRTALLEQLEALVKAGFLQAILALVDNNKARADDEAGARDAAMTVAAIDGELAAISGSNDDRRMAIVRFGREIAAAVGMTALILAALLAAL